MLLCSTTAATEIALVATTAKTVLQITAPAASNIEVVRIGVSFDSTSATAEPVIIRIYRQSTAGTAGSSLTPVKVRGDASGTIGTTAGVNYAAEPTNTDLIDTWEVHPQSGIDIFYPMNFEINVPASARLGMVITAPANVNCLPKMWFQE